MFAPIGQLLHLSCLIHGVLLSEIDHLFWKTVNWIVLETSNK